MSIRPLDVGRSLSPLPVSVAFGERLKESSSFCVDTADKKNLVGSIASSHISTVAKRPTFDFSYFFHLVPQSRNYVVTLFQACMTQTFIKKMISGVEREKSLRGRFQKALEYQAQARNMGKKTLQATNRHLASIFDMCLSMPQEGNEIFFDREVLKHSSFEVIIKRGETSFFKVSLTEAEYRFCRPAIPFLFQILHTSSEINPPDHLACEMYYLGSKLKSNKVKTGAKETLVRALINPDFPHFKFQELLALLSREEQAGLVSIALRRFLKEDEPLESMGSFIRLHANNIHALEVNQTLDKAIHSKGVSSLLRLLTKLSFLTLTSAGKISLKNFSLENTKELHLTSYSPQPGDVESVRSLVSLRTLKITNGTCDEVFVKEVVDHAPLIKNVVLCRCRYIQDFSFLSNCPRIKALDLSYTNFSDKDFQSIKGLPLVELKLVGCKKFLELDLLRGFSSLHRLYLGHTQLNKSQLALILPSFPHLEILSLNGCPIDNFAGVAYPPLLRRIEVSEKVLKKELFRWSEDRKLKLNIAIIDQGEEGGYKLVASTGDASTPPAYILNRGLDTPTTEQRPGSVEINHREKERAKIRKELKTSLSGLFEMAKT